MIKNLLIVFLTTICLQYAYAEPPVAKCYSKTVIPVFDESSYTLYAWQLDNDSYSRQGLDLTFSFSNDINDQSRTFYCNDIGYKEVTLYVHDTNGEIDSCIASLTVQDQCGESHIINGSTDTIAPSIFLQDSAQLLNLDSVAFGFLSASDFNLNSYDDQSLNRNIEFAFTIDFQEKFFYHHCDDPDEQEVRIYARDESNNITWADIVLLNTEYNCDGAITVDTVSPEIICPDSLILPMDATLVSVLNLEHIPVSVYDEITPENRIDLSFSTSDRNENRREFTCKDLGENIVQIVAYDHEGNTATCQFPVIVTDINEYCEGVDLTPPTILCDTNTTVTLEVNGEVSINVKDFAADAHDDVTSYENLVFSYSENDLEDTVKLFTCDDLGIYPLEIFVWDEAGNQASCSVGILIEDKLNACPDNDAPTALCLANQEFTVIEKDVDYNVNAKLLDAGSYDNITLPSNLLFSYTSDVADSIRTVNCDVLGTHTLTLYVTDEAGNQSTCEAVVVVTDTNNVCITSNDYTYQNVIKVYPNPTSEILHIDNLPTQNGHLILSVRSIIGKELYRKKVSKESLTMNLEFTSGIYLIEVRNLKGEIYSLTKLIKK